MSLIKCLECGKQISDKALSCPGCGCPIALAEKPETVKFDMPTIEKAQIDKFINKYPLQIAGIVVIAIFGFGFAYSSHCKGSVFWQGTGWAPDAFLGVISCPR